MATRRAHNKTRLGCSQCKKRRIKCDGIQPHCANCKKKELECSFLLLAPSTRLTATITKSPTRTTSTSESRHKSRTPSVGSSRSSSPLSSKPRLDGLAMIQAPKLPPSIQWNDPLTSLDIRDSLSTYHGHLLSQYKEITSLTMATDDPAKCAWQTYVPQLADDYKFVTHGIFSVTSLHLARLQNSDAEKQKLTGIAAEQMNQALAQFRTELENINKSNAPALFACATLTAVYFFRTSIVDLEETQASVPPDIVDPPFNVVDKSIRSTIQTFWALRGALSVLSPGWEWVLDSRMSPVCHRTWWPNHHIPSSGRAVEEDKRLAELEHLWLNSNGDESNFDCLSAALSHLRNTYALVSMLTDSEDQSPSMDALVSYSVDDTTVGSLRDRAAILVWATRLSKKFISLVEQKNREALVIVAYYAVLLGRVRNVWWLDGLGTGMLRGIAMALGKDQLHLIAWPAKTLDVDVFNRFGLDQLRSNYRTV